MGHHLVHRSPPFVCLTCYYGHMFEDLTGAELAAAIAAAAADPPGWHSVIGWTLWSPRSG